MNNLKAFRGAIGLSGEQFVESLKDCKVSRPTLVAYENGNRSIPEEFKEAVSASYPDMTKVGTFGYTLFNVQTPPI